jgi:hypothetical protein
MEQAVDRAGSGLDGNAARNICSHVVDMSWKLFVGATIVSAGLLIKVGAPLVPVLLGIAMAAFFNHRRQRGAIAKR